MCAVKPYIFVTIWHYVFILEKKEKKKTANGIARLRCFLSASVALVLLSLTSGSAVYTIYYPCFEYLFGNILWVSYIKEFKSYVMPNKYTIGTRLILISKIIFFHGHIIICTYTYYDIISNCSDSSGFLMVIVTSPQTKLRSF